MWRFFGIGGISGGGGEKDGGVWLTGGKELGVLVGWLWWGRFCRRGGMKLFRVGKVRGESVGAVVGIGGLSGFRDVGGLVVFFCFLLVLIR